MATSAPFLSGGSCRERLPAGPLAGPLSRGRWSDLGEAHSRDRQAQDAWTGWEKALNEKMELQQQVVAAEAAARAAAAAEGRWRARVAELERQHGERVQMAEKVAEAAREDRHTVKPWRPGAGQPAEWGPQLAALRARLKDERELRTSLAARLIEKERWALGDERSAAEAARATGQAAQARCAALQGQLEEASSLKQQAFARLREEAGRAKELEVQLQRACARELAAQQQEAEVLEQAGRRTAELEAQLQAANAEALAQATRLAELERQLREAEGQVQRAAAAEAMLVAQLEKASAQMMEQMNRAAECQRRLSEMETQRGAADVDAAAISTAPSPRRRRVSRTHKQR